MKKTIRILILIVLLAVILLPTLTACSSSTEDEQVAQGGDDTLVVYNWEDYIDEEVLEDFCAYYEEMTGRSLEITYTTYDTNETMMTKVLKGDANVDLICPSEYSIEKLMLAGCLLNQQDIYDDIKSDVDRYGIDLSNMSTLLDENGNKHYGAIEPQVMDVITSIFSDLEDDNGKHYDMTNYMVPYMWGTLGILYNTRVISEEELDEYGWGVLWNVQENEELENMILMKDSVRDSYAAAIFYMYEYNLLPDEYKGYSIQQLINCTDEVIVKKAQEVLTIQRDHISGYEVDFGKDDMINEIVYADLAWSGDAMWAIEEGGYDEQTDTYQLGYYVPKKASNIWYDGWCIPTTVKNKLAAMMFIDFMCRPENAIRNSIYIAYSSATSKEVMMNSEEAVSIIIDNEYDVEEYFADTARYPEIDETLGVMRDFGARNDAVVQMWQRAKSGGSVRIELLYIILAIALAVGLCLGVYFIIQVLKRRPRKIK